jgi:hypothetical protein
MNESGMNGSGNYGWHDGEPVVPAYAFTRGRTRPHGADLPLEALVTATERAVPQLPALQRESRAIVRMSMRPLSVVEIAAALRLPAGVVRVLVGDLANAGLLAVHPPQPTDAAGRPRAEILGRLLDGLRAR